MPLPDITPADVVAYAPGAPAVTADQVQEAVDWAEPQLTRLGVLLTPDSREERAAVRAVVCYALHLAAGTQASGTRTSTVTAQGALKSFEAVGEIKVERAVLTGAQLAQAQGEAAEGWLARAWAALRATGVQPARRVAGVSR